jgi:hypothetical protein
LQHDEVVQNLNIDPQTQIIPDVKKIIDTGELNFSLK